jgi:carbonic anhydrase
MTVLADLLASNRKWDAKMRANDDSFFTRLAGVQKKEYLWIGCSDRRVPASEIVDLLLGKMFVHRNIANLVVHTNFNMQAVLQYSINVLPIEHVIVCGHSGCGGVTAAILETTVGLADHCLRQVKDVYHKYQLEIDRIEDPESPLNRLCELNVYETRPIAQTGIVQNAWKKGHRAAIHSRIDSVKKRSAEGLGVDASPLESVNRIYRLSGPESDSPPTPIPPGPVADLQP